MKKNAVYIFLLLGLSVLCYFLFFSKEKEVFSKDEANFTVKNIDEVTKITLSDLINGTLNLVKKNNVWFVNDSTLARQEFVELLLDALKKQQPKNPVPKQQHDNVIKLMATQSTKVEVFKGAEKTNQFYVCQQSGLNNATYMLNIKANGKNAARPFIVDYENVNMYLGVRYVTSFDSWRSTAILYSKPENIVEIAMTYPDSPQNNYIIKTTPEFEIVGVDKKLLNKKRVKTYLDFFEKHGVMGFENNFNYKKEIENGKVLPFASISLKTKNTFDQKIDLYFTPISQGTKSAIKYKGKDYDAERFLGYTQNKDLVFIGPNNLKKLSAIRRDFIINQPLK
ncbi:MAG: hypothetical protein KA275_08065 [Chitinophagaceae bacterium]|nr:hypothetical protein [Chitinophagaceae bacterium]